jgi:sugar phosphate isomerase/epimerase
MQNRRAFIKGLGLLALGYTTAGWRSIGQEEEPSELFFKISLAQWSFHRAFFSGQITTPDLPAIARQVYQIDAVEYVSQFFKDKAEDKDYLKQIKDQADDNGVRNLLIMVDEEGDLGATQDYIRNEAVENHYKWIEAAKYLGCDAIRVNVAGAGTREAVRAAAVDGLSRLASFASLMQVNIVVENHGGYSSDGAWLAGVVGEVNMPNCGTLPDFGNFENHNPYHGMKKLLPYAKGVSAKSYAFDAQGNETSIDYKRMIKLVKASGFRGYIGIEYEGTDPDERKGVWLTKQLLEKNGRI